MPSSSLETIGPRPIKQQKKQKLLLDNSERLTKKQAAFVDFWMKNFSARQSALLAGYSPHTANIAHEILQHPLVVKEIRRRQDEALRNENVNAEWLLGNAVRMAKANILDFGEIQPDGTFKPDLNLCTRDQAQAIQEISWDPSGKMKIRLVDRKPYHDFAARAIGMFDETGDKPGKQGPLTIEYFDQILKNSKSVTVNQQFNVLHKPSQDMKSLPETTSSQ